MNTYWKRDPDGKKSDFKKIVQHYELWEKYRLMQWYTSTYTRICNLAAQNSVQHYVS